MWATKLGGCLLLLLLLVGGCQKLTGDYALDKQSGENCTPSVVQCVGNVLQRCNSKGTAWENAAVCASETLCDHTQGKCKQPACDAGARQCLGAELQGCNASRDGWVRLATCTTAGHCSAKMGACTEQPCMPGKAQCNGAVLQLCRTDQSGWDDKETCKSAGLCDAELGACTANACEPGQYNCDGPTLRICNDALTGWKQVQSCDSDALCNATTGSCGQAGCTTPGAFRCDAAGVLERCADDLTAWEFVESCDSTAHCDARNGMCDDAPCKPGDRQCNGSMLEVCNAASTGWDLVGACQTDGLCQETLEQNETSCMEAICETGMFQCVGAQPQICAPSLTEYRDNGEPCLTPELCNSASGTCAEPICDAGETRCTGAVPEICNAGRTMFVPHGTACASTTLCRPETGTCGNVVCLSGQKRCDPNDPTRLQICNATFDGWDDCDTCATPELCSASLGAATCGASSCTEPTCELTDRWCQGNGGRTLYKCPSSRISTQGEALGTCDSKELCDLTLDEPGRLTCVPKLCSLPDRWCGGDGNRTLYKCPPSLLNYQAIELDECATNALCEQAHADPNALSCPDPVCATGYSCGGTGSRTLQYCNPERTALTPCDTCDSAALCTDSLNPAPTACTASACHVCLPGQKMCSGSVLQICNSTRTGWATAATCASAVLCTNSLMPASQMTCDACVAGAVTCDGAQPQTCNDPGTGPAVWADLGDPCPSASNCNAATGMCRSMGGEGGAGGVAGEGGAGDGGAG
jgi:hypothetical protein